MLLRTFRCWSSFIAHLALLLVLNLVFDGPALAEQARLRSRLVELPAELEAPSPWPDEATVEEALRLLTPVPSPIPSLPPGEGRPLPPSITKGATTAPQGVTASSERAVEKSSPLEVETLGGGAPLPGEGRTMGEGSGVRGPVLLASAVPPPPSLPDMPAASTVTEAPQPMAAPASAPSPDAVSLLAGWNLISLPKQPDSVDPSAVLASISGSYNVAHTYDACSSDPWRTWDPADPAGSSLTAIDHRVGLWVRARAAATLAVSGTELAETSIQLCQGWNLIGYPLSQPRPVLAALSSIAGRFQRVYGWDPADPADPWEVFDVAVPAWANDLEQMLPGRGYWIYATADTTLVMSNTGLPPEVAITSPANAAAVTAPTDIKGTVRSNLLESWTLAYRLKGEAVSTTFASGNTPVTNGVLGKLNPTLLLNGLYEVELTATDFQGQSVSASIDVVVEGNLKIGHFTLSFVDMEVPLSGLPIQVIRTYDSRDKRVGDFGVGWRLSLSKVRLQEDGPVGENWRGTRSGAILPNYCVSPTRAHQVTVTLPDDTVLRFQPKLVPECQAIAPPQVVTIRYVPLSGTLGTLEAVDQGDRALVVGSFPGAVQLWDEEAVELGDPGRYRLTLPDGRVFVIDQLAGLLSVTDRNGNTLTYSRNGLVHSSGKGIAFQRDSQGRITRITDPMNNPVHYGYDANGDLRTYSDREGNVSRYNYDQRHHLLSFEDPSGIQPIRNEYDESGRLVRHRDTFGKVIELTHDFEGRREVITDRLGHSRLLEYDLRGNVTRETDAMGGVTTRVFDVNNKIVSETDPLGHTTRFTYDASQNLTSVVDPLGQTTRFTYDQAGNLLTTTDALGRVTSNVYDPKGNLLSATDALGNRHSYGYDARGNLVAETDAEGQVTRYEVDASGRVLSETDSLGRKTSFTYDANSNLLTRSMVRTTTEGPATLTWSYVYDRLGRLVRATDLDGSTTQMLYDEVGRIQSSIDKLGRPTSYQYDELGRRTRVTFPDGSAETTAYDAQDRRIASTDRAGRLTTYTYDGVGRLLTTTYPDGAVLTNLYDDAGRLIEARDARGAATRYQYDAAGRRTKVVDALGHAITFSYDVVGNQVAIADARGNQTHFEYDATGRQIRAAFPDGTSQVTEYDRMGRRTAVTDIAGRTTRFSYDSFGRLMTVTDALEQTTRYTYDELGNRTSQTDSKGNVTQFRYDSLGRVTAHLLPDGSMSLFAYDAVGNLLQRKGFNGAVTSFTYDANDQLVSRSHASGSTVGITYTVTGRRATVVDARGATRYSYDDRDRLTRLTYPDGRQILFSYDLQGNRTSTTAMAGGLELRTEYGYDALNRLETVTDPTGRVYSHAYDANGNLSSLTHPNGVLTSYGYDALNRLRTLSSAHALTGVVQSYNYELDPAGNRARIGEPAGTVLEYRYDDLYRLTQETVSRSAAMTYQNTFTYDEVGNRLRQDRSAGGGTESILYTYDQRNRLLTAGSTTYGWDPNGNLVSKSGDAGKTLVWDDDNRLALVQLADGTRVEHSYDIDGNRVRTKVVPSTGPPRVIEYLVDPDHSLASAGHHLALSQVVLETDGSGSLSQYYVLGDDRLAVLRPDSTRPGSYLIRNYHADGLGSIRALTDDRAVVTDRYDYEGFGSLRGHEGEDPNIYLFAGEALDSDSGLYYLRQRWMSPEVGRFASVDLFSGQAFDPISLHKYLYASADPINRIDPTGLQSLAMTLTAVALVGAAVAMWTTIIANDALGRRQTHLEIIFAGLAGAILAPTAYLVPGFGVLLAGYGIAGSGYLLYEVFANPNSTLFQKTEAVALALASIWGARVALRYYRSVQPRAVAETQPPPADPLAFPLNQEAPGGLVIEASRPTVAPRNATRIPEFMRLLQRNELPPISYYREGNRIVIYDGHTRMVAALEIFKQGGDPKWVFQLLTAGNNLGPPPTGGTTYRMTQ